MVIKVMIKIMMIKTDNKNNDTKKTDDDNNKCKFEINFCAVEKIELNIFKYQALKNI